MVKITRNGLGSILFRGSIAVPPVAMETEAKRRPDKLPRLSVDYASYCLPLNTIQSSLEASGLGRHANIS